MAKPAPTAEDVKKTERAVSKIVLAIAIPVALVAVVVTVILLRGGDGGDQSQTSLTTGTPSAAVTTSATSTTTASVTTSTPTTTSQPKQTTAPTSPTTAASTPITTPTPPPTPVTTSAIPKLPDLVVREITWFPVNFSLDENVNFSVVGANQGAGDAASCYIAFFVDGVYATSQRVALSAGAVSTYTLILNPPYIERYLWKAEQGVHKVKAVADYNGTVAEADETNNSKEVVLPEALMADLMVQDITWSPTSPSAADTVTVTVIISNIGKGNPLDLFSVDWYLDGEREWGNLIGSVRSGSLTTAIRGYKLSAGKHTIRFVVDDSDKVRESNETNNFKEVVITVS